MLDAVCETGQVSRERLLSRSRTVPLPFLRFLCFRYLHEEAGQSLPMIGRSLGYSHATVLHGIRQVQVAAANKSYIEERELMEKFERNIRHNQVDAGRRTLRPRG